ncbi:MAG: crossover junction endodeoxyribonuclease [Actinobacteria bacterium]|nr:MAG: crossover junction endodeoxyribonuclease [Actinomycetota bacterium]MDO8949279.1 crossover junction endodeoxyribonuclease RuvC [Actinomycetota bacterium]
MIILGIDPGLANTGWGVIEAVGSRFRCLAYGCITTAGTTPTPARLAAIHHGLNGVVARYRPVECGVENIYFSNNAKTAFATGQARGVALLSVSDLPVGEYGPGEIKLAVVGAGDADKRQVQYMVRIVLGLAEEPKPDHAADALATAICHANTRAGVALAEASQ